MRVLATIVFISFSLTINSQHLKGYLDSLSRYQSKEAINQVDSILLLGVSKELKAYALVLKGNYIRKINRDSAFSTFQKLEELINDVKDTSLLKKIHTSLAVYYDLADQSEKSLFYYLKSLKLSNDPEHLLDVYYNLTFFYSERGKLDSAVHYVTLGLNLADSLNLKRQGVDFQRLLSSQLFYQGDSIRALEVAEEALLRAIPLKDTMLLIKAHGNIVTKLTQRQSEKALYHTKQAIKLAEAIQANRILAFQYLALGDIQTDIASTKEAAASYKAALAIFQKQDMPEPHTITLARLLSLPLMYINADELDSLAFIIENRLRQLNFTLFEQANFYKILRDYYLKSKRSDLAVKAAIKLDSIRKEQFDAEKNQAIEELIKKYETAQKEAEIKQLITDNQNKSLQLNAQRLFIILIVLAAVSAIVIGYLIYSRRLLRNKREAENLRQKLLRIQLNPHFMFNSLNAIQSMIYQNKDTQKTADYLAKFSHLTRQILEFNQHELISLEDEIKFIKNYLSIQQTRFDDPFQFNIKVDDKIEAYELQIPPMITQPFLENAVEHGISEFENKGEIQVRFILENEFLQVIIMDNGIGREQAALKKKSKNHRSMATSITRERLRLWNEKANKNFSMAIDNLLENNKVVGTAVVFQLPLIYSNN